MNTKSLPHQPRDLFRNLTSRTAAIALAAFLGVMAPPSLGRAESIDALRGLSPMNAAELEESYGGFILPNGMNINIGIETDISIDGKQIVHNYYSSGNFHPVKSATEAATRTVTTAKIEQLGTTTSVYPVASSIPASQPEASQPETQTAALPSGNTTVTTVVNPLTGLPTTLISNSANQAVISQVQKITIDISNFAVAKLQAYRALATLKSQAVNGLLGMLH